MVETLTRDPPTKINIGPELHADLEREVSRLMGEWRAATNTARKRALEQQVQAILDLIGGSR